MIMKKTSRAICAATCLLALLMLTVSAQAVHEEVGIRKDELKKEIMDELREEMKQKEGPLAEILQRIQLGGYIEFGGAWQTVDNQDGSDYDESDLNMTTLELSLEAEVNEWVNVAAVLLYEDFTFGEDTSIDLDVAIVDIGKNDRCPFYLSLGKMYVPFGGLLTHFPDDPLVDSPLTLLLGETLEKAALVGFEQGGLGVYGYVFNGDVEEAGDDNQIDDYGLDAHYVFNDEQGFDVLIGASYINNIAEADFVEGELETNELRNYVDGFDAYFHIGYADFFFEAEYMTALDEFEANELEAGYGKAEPAVWNFEGGYNWDWGRDLEIVLNYAGSDEGEALGFPEKRYGLCLNQEIWEPVLVSLAYLHDKYEDNDKDARDERDIVFGQIAIEF